MQEDLIDVDFVAGLVTRVAAARLLVGRGREDTEVLPMLCSPTTCSWLARALVVWKPATSEIYTIFSPV